MFANTGAFFTLLVYSIVVGASLGVFYDILVSIGDTLFPSQVAQPNSKRTLGVNSYEAEHSLYPYQWKFGTREIFFIVLDLVFWCICAVCVIVLLYHLNYGEIRGFSLVSAFVGFAIYRYTVGKPMRFLLKKTLKSILFCIAFGLKKISKPIRVLKTKIFIPIIEKRKSAFLRQKARKYLLLMQENEIKLRKTKNERNKSVGSDR